MKPIYRGSTTKHPLKSSLCNTRKSLYSFKPRKSLARSRLTERILTKQSVIIKGVGVGILGASLNIANTIIGGGILELPYVMAHFGVILTIFLFLFTYFLIIISLLFLLKAKEYTHLNDYKSLSRYTFGPRGSALTDFSIFFNNFGICIGYLIIFEASFVRLLQFGFDIDIE